MFKSFSIDNFFNIQKITILLWLLLGWGFFILSLLGFFYKEIIIVLFFLVSLIWLFSFYIFWKKQRDIEKNILSINSLIWILIVFLSGIYLSYFPPSLFSGRDQGSISEAAIRLATNHKLEFTAPLSKDLYSQSLLSQKLERCLSNNKNYLLRNQYLKNKYCYWITTGPALNYPGFYYTSQKKLITQFPLPYISWLAGFYDMFNLNGLKIANLILFWLFLGICYKIYNLIAVQILKIKYSQINFWLFLIFFLTPTLFWWLLRLSLTENLAWTLFWLGIWQLLEITLRPKIKFINYLILELSLGWLVFTRIEGIIIWILTFLILLYWNKQKIKQEATKYFHYLASYVLFMIIVGIMDIIVNFPFYKSIIKAIFGSNLSTSIISNGHYFLKIYIYYNLIGFLILSLISVIFFIYTKTLNQKKIIPFFIPIFINSPFLFYFVNPHISADQPWCLRRFLWNIFPLSILYSLFFIIYLAQKQKKAIAYFLTIILILINFVSLKNFLFFSPERKVWPLIQKMSQNFQANDLILVDRLALGNGWIMPTGPLNLVYHKQAVYFFNPKNYAKIKANNFHHIYLITPVENFNFWKKDLPKDFNFMLYSKYNLTAVYYSHKVSFFSKNIKSKKIEGLILQLK